jgi:subtilase family serine protease
LGAPQLQRAYGLPAMLAAGINGTGTTIATIVPYGNPWVVRDLDLYSRRYGLPPARVTIISYGRVTPAAAHGAQGRHAAREGTEDLEMMHALAPGATLVYVQAPDADPRTLYDRALSWVATSIRPDVVSFSSGVPEFDGLPTARSGLRAAARAGVTVVAASGDTGATQPAGPDASTLFAPPVGPIALWPTSDPLATAVGGTWLHLNPFGARLRPDTAFSDVAGSFAGGAGHSAFFPRPAWQDSVRAGTGDHRAIADVSMDASECSPGAIYQQAQPPAGWATTQGTSMSTPLLAALVADTAQAAGHRLGLLGPALYTLHGPGDGLLDVTQGNDSIPGMPGWPARPGYDLPTGIGTVAAALPFVTALARAAS